MRQKSIGRQTNTMNSKNLPLEVNVEHNELVFPPNKCTQTFKLSHPGHTEKRVVFKMKTTHPRTYLTRPNCGILEPGQSTTIQITIVDWEYQRLQRYEPSDIHRRKMLVQMFDDIPPDMFFFMRTQKEIYNTISELEPPTCSTMKFALVHPRHPKRKIPTDLKEMRKRNGLCIFCGSQIYKVERGRGLLFGKARLTALNIEGVVMNGRCLLCHPLATRTASAETSIPLATAVQVTKEGEIEKKIGP